jgi:hypothetical protein
VALKAHLGGGTGCTRINSLFVKILIDEFKKAGVSYLSLKYIRRKMKTLVYRGKKLI